MVRKFLIVFNKSVFKRRAF